MNFSVQLAFWSLVAIGAAVGLAKLLVSSEALSWRHVIGKMILGAATAIAAGLVLIQFPALGLLPMLALGSALSIAGSQAVESLIKTVLRR